jgi:EAL domain-containing protein (putative c-di-GMP-specific phosphodiesterase class I)
MYHAKVSGRNRFCFFSDHLRHHSSRTLQLTAALRHALDRGEFHLHYQPQISLTEQAIVGSEALLRWNHPEMGAISPAEFIPLLEESGLITKVGEWVLRTAVAQLKSWMDGGMESLIMAVNISVAQFRDRGLPDLVSSILDKYGVPPEWLELEITESVAINNQEFHIRQTENRPGLRQGNRQGRRGRTCHYRCDHQAG